MTAGRQSISETKDWNTPPDMVAAVRVCLGGRIQLDPCSNEYSVVGADVEWCLPIHDGLQEKWNYKTIFVNPPYGRDKERGTSIRDWLHRVTETHQRHHAKVIALIPVATNTRHWQENIFKTATSICFPKATRFKFMLHGAIERKGAPMACCVVYWGHNADRFQQTFDEWGKVIRINQMVAQADECCSAA